MMELKRVLCAAGLAAGLVLSGHEAGAVLISIDQCWSSCENVANDTATVATVNITVNGPGTVATFVVTNLVGNLGADATAGTIISRLNMYYSDTEAIVLPAPFTGPQAQLNAATFGSFVDASLTFNIHLDFPPPPGTPGSAELFTNAEVFTFDITGTDLTESDFTTPPSGQDATMMVHIQRLADEGSVKFVDSGTPTTVPEPSALLLLGGGLMGLSLLRRRRRR